MDPFPFIPWVWRDAPGLVTDRDRDDEEAAGPRPDTGLIGYDVEAVDGTIGSIDKANAEVPSDCLLVDTGPWIFGRKVVLPVGTVERVDHDARKVHVDRTKEQVKDSPEYDPDTFDSDEYRRRIGDYYTESYRRTPPL